MDPMGLLKAPVRFLVGRAMQYSETILCKSKAMRRIYYDILPPNTVVVAQCRPERFLVNSSDQIIGRSIYVNGECELWKTEFVLNKLRTSKDQLVIVDIGANIGIISIPLVVRGLAHRAIAIEPDPNNFNLLCANIYINNLSESVIALNVALGDHEDTSAPFELSQDNFGDHRIRVTEAQGQYNELERETISVKLTTLDEVLKEQDPTKLLLWMDTQGYEGFIFAGGFKTLQNTVPLVTEFWPYGMLRAGSFDKFRHSLVGAGYKYCYDLAEQTPVPMDVSFDTFDRLFELYNERQQFTDLFVTSS